MWYPTSSYLGYLLDFTPIFLTCLNKNPNFTKEFWQKLKNFQFSSTITQILGGLYSPNNFFPHPLPRLRVAGSPVESLPPSPLCRVTPEPPLQGVFKMYHVRGEGWGLNGAKTVKKWYKRILYNYYVFSFKCWFDDFVFLTYNVRSHVFSRLALKLLKRQHYKLLRTI